MPFRWDPRHHVSLARHALKWVALAAPVGVAGGAASAIFLRLLDAVTNTRFVHPWLIYLLPAAGVLVAVMYQLLGKSAEGGNALIIDRIHEPGGGVPARMAPLVLIGTLVTHLFGGSAGREGTAVQMGGSLASTLARLLRLSKQDARLMLMAGVAAGFGAVFGTPLTGAIFAMEVLALGKMSYEALVPCFVASVVGDYTCTHLGVTHTAYYRSLSAPALAHLDPWLLAKVAGAGVVFGLTGLLFCELAHSLGRLFKLAIRWPWLRPAVGGAIVVGLAWALHTPNYLGLGVAPDPNSARPVTILTCFSAGGADAFSWWWKILFTAVTVSCGFKGGEVTPLFFIGAALGNTLALASGAPVDLFAALGFVAVFAGATNTPLACTIMGVELFAPAGGAWVGSGLVVYLATACFTAYLFSGHSGIYTSQRIGTPKHETEVESGTSLAAARERLGSWFRRR